MCLVSRIFKTNTRPNKREEATRGITEPLHLTHVPTQGDKVCTKLQNNKKGRAKKESTARKRGGTLINKPESRRLVETCYTSCGQAATLSDVKPLLRHLPPLPPPISHLQTSHTLQCYPPCSAMLCCAEKKSPRSARQASEIPRGKPSQKLFLDFLGNHLVSIPSRNFCLPRMPDVYGTLAILAKDVKSPFPSLAPYL